MTPEVRQAVEQLPFVRWIGPLHSAYRLEEFMLDNAHRAEGAGKHDVNHDGVLDIDDVFEILANWGPCP